MANRMLFSLPSALGLLLLVACHQSSAPQPEAAPPANPSAPTAAAPSAPQTGMPNFARLVKEEGPAVVNISSTTAPAADNGAATPSLPGTTPGDPLDQFFRQFGEPQKQPVQSMGSGFIISKDGYLLTNYHVVEGASDIRVRLTDQREFKGKVVGTDKLTDIALLKIDANDLPVARIGDSNRLQVGEWIAAIGSPFGFDNSITQGIVSAKGRYLPSENYVPFIQTDAAINPGNSGGPLFNLNAQVVGITSQIYSQTGGYMGIGFAIPINVAMDVAQQLRTQGHVVRGRLGAVIQSVTPALAKSFGLANSAGALVVTVEKNGPAAQAGMKAGDVITRLNGQVVPDANQLPGMVAQLKPGMKVPVVVIRQGKPLTLTVKLGELAPQKTPAPQVPQAPTPQAPLGLTVRPLKPEEQKQLNTTHGLLIEQAQGAAAAAGIHGGDVLLAVNNVEIHDLAQLQALLKQFRPGQVVALMIQRGSDKIYVPVTLGP